MTCSFGAHLPLTANPLTLRRGDLKPLRHIAVFQFVPLDIVVIE